MRDTGILLSNNSLELAFDNTSAGWFPINPTVLEAVRTRLSRTDYDGNRQALVEDLKVDFSLFFYCVKELGKMTDGAAGGRSPTELIQSASNRDLAKILAGGSDKFSAHSFDRVSKLQALRLRESMFSATTAEVLSAKLVDDPNLGFTCALLRQLGLTLLAWNYPHVYRNALDCLAAGTGARGQELDVIMHNSLGFSPTMLGIRFADSWRLSPTIISVVRAADPSVRARAENNSKEESILTKICAVGEAFARANDPQHYPRARMDWEEAEKVIKRHLGPDGVADIYRKAGELARHYSEQVPQLSDHMPSSSYTFFPSHAKDCFESNIYLKACSTEVQEEFAKVYSESKSNQVSQEALRMMVHDVVPRLGFEDVAVFMLDPALEALLPVLKRGNPSFIKLRTLSLLDPSCSFNPIVSAFNQNEPISEEGIIRGKRRKLFAGVIGNKRKMGVLYLECEVGRPKSECLLLVKVIIQTLHDLLNCE